MYHHLKSPCTRSVSIGQILDSAICSSSNLGGERRTRRSKNSAISKSSVPWRMHLKPMKFGREHAEADPLIAIAGGGVNPSIPGGAAWKADYLKITGEL